MLCNNGSMNEVYDFLRKVYFFHELEDADLKAIAELAKRASYPAGASIFNEGDEAHRFFVVMHGQIEIWKNTASGSSGLLAQEGVGHIFGEMALVDDLPRSATVICSTEVEVIYLDRLDFIEIMHSRPPVLHTVLRALSSMIRKSNESYIEDLSRRNAELEVAYKDLKEAQDELIRSERFSNLGKLVSLIIHDLRNPISVIKGYGEMMYLLQDDVERIRDYSKKIVQEADRLNAFATELLDYSRGEIRLNVGPVRIMSIFDRLNASYSMEFSRRNIRLSIEGDESLVAYVDVERLVRALGNLLDNARKAIGEGGKVILSAYGRKSKAGSDLIHITVADTGEGIQEDQIEKIFEPFFSSSRMGGTGLGMVSVKNIVEAHGGKITVQSKLGVGTRMHIILPAQKEKVALRSQEPAGLVQTY